MSSFTKWLKSLQAWWDKMRGKTSKPPRPYDPEEGVRPIPDYPRSEMTDGNKVNDKGPEIWMHNWHSMNIRLYNNGGHPKELGIAQGSTWYPIDHANMPADAIILYKTVTGCEVSARDFESFAGGQKYRFLGFWSDGKKRFERVYRIVLKNDEMHGALIANWGSYK